MILPAALCLHDRQYGRDAQSTPFMFTLIMHSHSSSLTAASGERRMTPALLPERRCVPICRRGLRKGRHGVTVGHVPVPAPGRFLLRLESPGGERALRYGAWRAAPSNIFAPGGAKLPSDALADAAGGARDQNDLSMLYSVL